MVSKFPGTSFCRQSSNAYFNPSNSVSSLSPEIILILFSWTTEVLYKFLFLSSYWMDLDFKTPSKGHLEKKEKKWHEEWGWGLVGKLWKGLVYPCSPDSRVIQETFWAMHAVGLHRTSLGEPLTSLAMISQCPS